MKYTALIGNKETQIEFHPDSEMQLQAKIADRTYSLTFLQVEPGVFWFSNGTNSIEAAVIENEKGYSVSLNGRHIEMAILDGRSIKRHSGLEDQNSLGKLEAIMPGKVVKILVEEGSAVENNQALVVIEAMKMQNEMRAPKAGNVKQISIEEGSTVDAGTLLIVIE